MISGLVLKYLNGECFVIRRGYETTLPVSTSFCLTVPVDLIGAFKADMREADNALISSGSLFVDSRDTTLHHIGELMIPLAAGIINESDIRGDFYDLIASGTTARKSDDEITVFKNGGGAHLDLMIADYISGAVARKSSPKT